MAIAIYPSMNLAPLVAASATAGQGAYNRWSTEQARQDEELRQRERLKYADIAAQDTLQNTRIAEAQRAQLAQFGENQVGREFDLSGKKELYGLQTEEAQRAREFGFGADQALQRDRLEVDMYQSNLSAAQQMMEAQQRAQQAAWTAQFNAAQRQRELAMQNQYKMASQQMGHQQQIGQMGYEYQLNQMGADAGLGRYGQQLGIQNQYNLQLSREQAIQQQQQAQAEAMQQLRLIDQYEADGLITEQTAERYRQQVIAQASGGTHVPGFQPPVFQPIPGDNSGGQVIFNPNTGEYEVFQPRPQQPTGPTDFEVQKAIADHAAKLHQQSFNTQTGSYGLTYEEALSKARQAFGVSGAGGGMPPMGGSAGVGAGAPPQAGVAQPRTQADYDALPSGAVYVDPSDGKVYRKS